MSLNTKLHSIDQFYIAKDEYVHLICMSILRLSVVVFFQFVVLPLVVSDHP